MVVVSILLAACGNPASAPSPTPPAEQPIDAVVLSVGVRGEALAFDVSSLSVPSGSQVLVTLTNTSVVIQHNWALVADGTKNDVADAGFDAGPSAGWLPVNDQRLIAATKLIEPATVGSVGFKAPAAGVYQFVCTVPGHNITMFGDFTVTP